MSTELVSLQLRDMRVRLTVFYSKGPNIENVDMMLSRAVQFTLASDSNIARTMIQFLGSADLE